MDENKSEQKKLSVFEMLLLLLFSTLMLALGYALSFLRKYIALPNAYSGFPLALIYLLFLIAAVFAAYKLVSRRSLGYYGLRFNLGGIKSAFLFFTLLFPIALLGRLVDPEFDMWYASQNSMLTIAGVFFFIAVMIIVVAKEEIIERTLLQSRLSEAYGSIIVIPLLSLNFAIMHYFGRDNAFHAAMMVIFVFLGSMVVASLFEVTKSVFATLLLHILSNSAVAFQIYLHAKGLLWQEFALWMVWGILFVVFFSRAVGVFSRISFKIPKLRAVDYIFMALFGIAVPLALVVLL